MLQSKRSIKERRMFMKKWIRVLALLVIIGITSLNCSVAEAAENGVEIVHVGRTVEQLTGDTFEMTSQDVMGNISQPMATNASYTVYRYTDAFEFYVDGEWIGRADVEAIVWHYTDGKVHLYQRTIRVSRLADYDADRTYGSIVNTDGSYSYTTGDRVYIYGYMEDWTFAIDFYVSNTEAYFTCYEV